MENEIFRDQEQQEQSGGSLRDFLTVFFKHKNKILTIFIAVVATVTAVTYLLSPTYEAQSTLLVKFGREFTYRPEVNDRPPMIAVNQEEALNSEINIITSRDLIQKVITTLQVRNIYPELLQNPPASMTPLDAAITIFSKSLSVEVVKKTNVLQVSLQHKNPHIAAKAVNLLVEFYKERHFQVYNGPESEFLERQLTSYEQKLKDSEDKLQTFKLRNGVYSLEEQRGLLLRQRMELDATLKTSQSRIDGMRRKLVTLQSKIKHLGEKNEHYTQSERDKIIVDAKAQLLSLQLKERDLVGKYPESNGLVANVRKDIAVVSAFLKEQEADILTRVKTSNAVYQEAEKEAILTEAELNSEVAKANIVRQQRSQLDDAVRGLDRNEKPLQNLTRDVSTNDKNYRNYLDRFEEARISNDMNRQKMANLSVIQAATAPVKPIKPKKVLNIVIGMILGAISGLGYAMLAEYTSQGISSPEEAQKRLRLPVLATVGLKG